MLPEKKNDDSPTLTSFVRKPVPEWVPPTSGSITQDDLVKEVSLIGFDRDLPWQARLAALKELMKHKGMFIERVQTQTVDMTQVEVAREMFRQLSPEERRAWLEAHTQPQQPAINVRNTSKDRES